MNDFHFELKDGGTGWLSNIISPILDDYPIGYSKDIKEGVLFCLNDGSSRTVFFNEENASCTIKNELTGNHVNLSFADFLSDESLAVTVRESLEDVKKPDLNALKQRRSQLEDELRQLNAEIGKIEKKLGCSKKSQTKSRKM